MWLIKNFVVIMYSLLVAVLSLLIFPIDFNKKLSNSLMRVWTNGVLFIYGVNVNVFGAENIIPGTGKVYISNHASYLDIFVQLAKMPDNVRMIYKKEINRVPLLGWAMIAAGFISIDRKNTRKAMGALDKAAEKIKKGLSIVIYPEGTRTRDGNVGEFKRGMFYLTEKSEADIIPVSLSNSFELMPGGSVKVKSGTINMVIGKPLKYKKDKQFLNEIREIVIQNLKPV